MKNTPKTKKGRVRRNLDDIRLQIKDTSFLLNRAPIARVFDCSALRYSRTVSIGKVISDIFGGREGGDDGKR